ncbi:MAG: prolyl oligopeptidase family serine peptidase [Gemmatimonadetes bacterium]|nr:prolyl oligopeptidase family serine peptidase [Gemmatimonadota bacterium]
MRIAIPRRAAASRAAALALAVAVARQAPAQQPATFDFSIRNIMRGPEVYGREPAQVRWSPDGQWIHFQWLPPGSDFRETPKPYRVRAQAGARPERLTEAQADSAGPLIASGSTSLDRTRRAVEYRGDLYVVDLGKSVARRLTETNAPETNPRFSSDGQRVFFVREGNAYSIDLGTGLTRQLTDIRAADAPAAAAPAATGGGRGGQGGAQGAGRTAPQARAGGALTQRGAIEADQKKLLEAVRDMVAADSIRRYETGLRDSAAIRPVVLRAGERLQALSVSPGGTAIIFTATTAPADARTGIVPSYVTTSGYTEDIPNRTKVGDAQGVSRLGFQRLPRGEVQWLRPLDGDSTPPNFVGVAGWNDAGTTALVVATSRDFKTRQLSAVDATTGALTTLDVLRDTAWVGGPCSFGCTGFADGNRRVYYVSEASGYAQLYGVNADGSDRKALTDGMWEVTDVALSADRKSFLLHSSEVSAFDRDYWQMPVAGGPRTRLTRGAGGHQVVPSPDEQWMADVYSTANRPPEIFLGRRGAAGIALTASPTADWLAFNWITPEIVMIPASDGARVPARLYRPRDMKAQPNGAAVIFVHGAGYLHNVHHYWSSYAREFMFNHYLASKGYVVLDIDYRASAGYGRDWRTAIYRWMGGRDLQDQVDGSRYLTREFGIDPERIGMYGGSYGGFMTLMALFTAPKYFGAGAALRSVTDWAHYNHGYTGAILNLPQNDTLSYHRSSPIFFAEGLEDPLLMAHGMVDTNVNFQDIVRLTEKLIELGKTDWELAPYPVEDHGFTRPASWADEYTRIFNLFERTIGPNGSKARR